MPPREKILAALESCLQAKVKDPSEAVKLLSRSETFKEVLKYPLLALLEHVTIGDVLVLLQLATGE